MTTPATVVDKTPAVWEDFVDVFHSPSQVFERRRGGRFGLALLLLIVLAAVLLLVTQPLLAPVYDAIISQTIAQAQASDPQMTAEMAAQMRGWTETFFIPGLVLNLLIAVLAAGLALWLTGKLFDSTQTLGQAMMVSTYANVPRFVLGTLVSALLTFVLPADALDSPFAATLSPARFVDSAAEPLLAAALSRVELFTLWTTVLLGIGLAVTGKVPRRNAFVAAAIVWLLGGLLVVAGALRGAA